MLGLLAHALHVLLIVLGLVGVAALLLPQLLHARAVRRHGYRPPQTTTEHERRVARLREAAREGRLAAPPRTEAELPTWAVAHDGSPWRTVAVGGTLAAAVVHAEVFPHHLEESLVQAAFFFLVAVAQGLWAWQVSRGATERLLVVGVLGNAALIALWVLTRTSGLPLGLTDGTEAVGAWDLAAVAWEAGAVVACLVGLRRPASERRLTLGHLGPASWAFVVVSVLALTVLTVLAPHE